MRPAVKYGLLVGSIFFAASVFIGLGATPIAIPVQVIGGVVAAYFATREERPITPGHGAKVGSIAGAISGGMIAAGPGTTILIFFLIFHLIALSPTTQAMIDPDELAVSPQLLAIVSLVYGLIVFVVNLGTATGVGMLLAAERARARRRHEQRSTQADTSPTGYEHPL
jgi:hypothetical protein